MPRRAPTPLARSRHRPRSTLDGHPHYIKGSSLISGQYADTIRCKWPGGQRLELLFSPRYEAASPLCSHHAASVSCGSASARLNVSSLTIGIILAGHRRNGPVARFYA